MSALIDQYDGAFFDLDGVIYLGAQAIDGAADTMAELRRRGVSLMYVTNNAARSAQTVVDQLVDHGMGADMDTVLTSGQVAAANLADELPPHARILVAGSAALAELMTAAGFAVVESADDDPVAVIQGYEPKLRWPMLDEACLAIQRGARWYATNDDHSRPTERGLIPGMGGMIASIALAVGGEPEIFGKPYRPMLDVARARTGATQPIFVGDRLDTDVLGANNAAIDSLMVLSGSHGKAELLEADAAHRPTFIGPDVSALLAAPRRAAVDGFQSHCAAAHAWLDGHTVMTSAVPTTLDEQVDAAWAVLTLIWACRDAGKAVDATAVLEELNLVR